MIFKQCSLLILNDLFWLILSGPVILFIILHRYLVDDSFFQNLMAFFGVSTAFLGIWISARIFRLGNAFNEALNRTIQSIRQLNIQALQAQHIENLRQAALMTAPNTYENVKWNYLFRFESNNQLRLDLATGGSLIISILGKNLPAFPKGNEVVLTPIFQIRVEETFEAASFGVGDIAYCVNGSETSGFPNSISKHFNGLHLINAQAFKFSVLGPLIAVDPKDTKFYPRLKDLKEFP